MSEYQYYEFQAIDRRLTSQEMGELRSFSTRAQITPTSFVNEYNWGNFKGDEDAWMERYFDAFLYFANWGTRKVMLRLPAESLRSSDIEPYAGHDAFSSTETNGKVVLSFVLQSDDGPDYVDDDETLSAILPVRDGLLRGDLRALYIGWLLAVQSHDVDSDELEPPVPPGLDKLDEALEALVSFLCIDDDLLEVAAEASGPMVPNLEPTENAVKDWLAKRSSGEKDAWLAKICMGQTTSMVTEIMRRFHDAHAPKRKTPAKAGRRTVEELLNRAESRAEERERTAKEKATAEAERQRLQAERERTAYLKGLVGQENRLWAQADDLAISKQPKNYDAAVQLLQDLRDLAARSGASDFRMRLDAFRTTHGRKPTLLERITKANL